MSLAPGQALSFYEILGPLGAGGMGEVYRARDTRLEREVAIKVLPEELAGDEDRLRRFEREAKTLAALNHPNVAQVFGIDQVGDTCFMAMELVSGEDLAARLARGALPIEEALDVCRQIAEGVEAAHEAGVIHRDLKPANVVLTPAGRVKVLDFGLAKPAGGGGGTTALEDSALRTEEGLVLGTPTYMAPEQARGRPVDKRVDLWALGCVLYECLTGRRTFDGATAGEVIGAVLEREPDADALPERTPARIRELVERCLAKDPRGRLRDAGDARLELERALAERAWTRSATPAIGASERSWWGPLGIALAALAAGALLANSLRGPSDPPRALRLSIDIEVPYQEIYPRISPDGRTVVHEGLLDGDTPGRRALFRRDLDDFLGVPIPGTENPNTFCFSPDGEELAVVVEPAGRGGALELVRVPLDGSRPPTELGGWPRGHVRRGGIAWLSTGELVASGGADRLVVFPSDGGSPRSVLVRRAFEHPGAAVDVFRSVGEGRHVLGRTYSYEERGYLASVVAVDVETGEEKVVARDAGHATLAPDGRLLFTRGETLFAAPFDAVELAVAGPAVPLADGLRTETNWEAAWFDVARDGTLIWLPGGKQGSRRYLSVFGHDGRLTSFWPERLSHGGDLATSPDGAFVTTQVVSDDGTRVELWGSEVESPRLRRLFAAPGTDFLSGLPLPGGSEVVYRRFSGTAGGGIYLAPLGAAGEERLLLRNEPGAPSADPVAVFPDGRTLLLAVPGRDGVQFSTSSLEPSGDAERLPLLRTEYGPFYPKISADGRWLAFVAGELDRPEILVRALDGRRLVGRELAVPMPGDSEPWDFVWSRDPATGSLDFLMVGTDRRSFYAVPFEDPESGVFGEPRLLGTVDDAYVLEMEPVSDGRVLLVLQDPEEEEMDRIAVVMGALPGAR